MPAFLRLELCSMYQTTFSFAFWHPAGCDLRVPTTVVPRLRTALPALSTSPLHGTLLALTFEYSCNHSKRLSLLP
jgi:hypothetical protein